jgi:hypothetical protein
MSVTSPIGCEGGSVSSVCTTCPTRYSRRPCCG